MQETNEMRDRLIRAFAENYMEKLFYFCLKKTGSHEEAEDLTQDITLQVMVALNKGTVPESFSAWIWQIARNRYSVWAKEKHNRRASVTGSDIGDYEIGVESENVLDERVHAEQLALLRRELAFIKSDYRNIVVAYYLEDKNVREIAGLLSLPTNTVKSRLLRAREILKVGREAREKIWNYNNSITEKLAGLLEKLVDAYTETCGAHGIGYYGAYTTYEDAKWVLLLAFDTLADAVCKREVAYTKRPDNGYWDIVGYQTADVPTIPWVGMRVSDENVFQYKFLYKNIEAKTPPYLCAEEAHSLAKVAVGKSEECEPRWLDKLAAYGYIKKNGAAYEPSIAVFRANTAEESLMCFTDKEKQSIAETAEEIKRIIAEARTFSFKLTAESMLPLFKDNERLCYFACSHNMMSRDIIFMQAIQDDWIRYDEKTSKTVGAFIRV